MIPFLTFVFVMVVTAILFGSWVVLSIGRFFWRAITGQPRSMNPAMGLRPCMNPMCRSGNPMHAQFCRRCGSNLRSPVFNQHFPQPGPGFDPSNGRANSRRGKYARV
jgi:hypothetical protein